MKKSQFTIEFKAELSEQAISRIVGRIKKHINFLMANYPHHFTSTKKAIFFLPREINMIVDHYTRLELARLTPRGIRLAKRRAELRKENKKTRKSFEEFNSKIFRELDGERIIDNLFNTDDIE